MQKTSQLPNTVVYSQSNCPACEKAKYLLDQYGYTYEVRQLDNNPEMKKKLLTDFPDARSVPQIIVAGVRIGNLHALNDYLTAA